MNASEIVALIRKRLDEMVEDNSHWDDPRILAFVNAGLDVITVRLPAPSLPELWDTDTQNLIGNQSLYDMPSGLCKLIDVKVNGVPAEVRGIDYEKVLLNNYLYTPSTTRPYVLYPYYQNKAKVFPEPTALIVNGLVSIFLRLAVRLVNDGDVPELPYFTHTWLVDWGLYSCLLEDGDPRAVNILADFEKNCPAPGGKNG